MKHLFVPYKLALKLKEKGFDERCIIYYNEGMLQLDSSNTMFGWRNKDFEEPYMKDRERIPAPLYQQIVDWFREKHGIVVSIQRAIQIEPELYGYQINYGDAGDGGMMEMQQIELELSYYEALNKAIEEAIKLI